MTKIKEHQNMRERDNSREKEREREREREKFTSSNKYMRVNGVEFFERNDIQPPSLILSLIAHSHTPHEVDTGLL